MLLIGEPKFEFALATQQKTRLTSASNEAIRIIPYAFRSTFGSPLDALDSAWNYEVAADIIGEAETLTWVATTKESTGAVKITHGPTGDIAVTSGKRFRIRIRLSGGVSEAHETLLPNVFCVV